MCVVTPVAQVTEWDYNAHEDVAMGDHSVHAQQLHKFYKIMFSHEVGEAWCLLSSRRWPAS